MFTPNGQLFVNNKSGILTVKIDKVEFTGPTLASVLHQYRNYKRLPELPTNRDQQLVALAQLAEKNPTLPVLRRTPPPRTVAAPAAAPPRTVAAQTVAGPATLAARTVAGPATLPAQNRAGRLGLNNAAQQAKTLAAQQAKTLAAQQAKTLAAQQAAEESFRTLATEQAAQRAAQQAKTLARLPHLKNPRIVDTIGSPQRLPAQGSPLTNHEKHSLLGWVGKASPNPAAY